MQCTKCNRNSAYTANSAFKTDVCCFHMDFENFEAGPMGFGKRQQLCAWKRPRARPAALVRDNP